jgi:phosphoribosyl 1,2-cyclic phosphodiesterase
MPGALRIWVLTSGSSGNCILLWNASGAVMIDCGLGPRQLQPYLEQAGLRFSDIRGALITHLHGDHVSAAMVKKLGHEGVLLYCHQDIARHLSENRTSLTGVVNLRLLRPFGGVMFRVGPFRVKPFAVPHDAPGGCYGYTLYARTSTGIRKVSLATDIGEYDQALVRRFSDSDVVIIESNYDERMLEQTERPQWLKDRIRNCHFSNDQCSCFVNEVLARSTRLPQVIIQAHVSQESNTVAIAGKHVRSRLAHQHRQAIRLVETHHLRDSELITLE